MSIRSPWFAMMITVPRKLTGWEYAKSKMIVWSENEDLKIKSKMKPWRDGHEHWTNCCYILASGYGNSDWTGNGDIYLLDQRWHLQTQWGGQVQAHQEYFQIWWEFSCRTKAGMNNDDDMQNGGNWVNCDVKYALKTWRGRGQLSWSGFLQAWSGGWTGTFAE